MNRKVVKSSVLTLALMMVMVFAMSLTVYANATVTNLTQTSDSDNSVKVEWIAVTENVYYGVQIARDAGFTDIVQSAYTTSTYELLGGYSCPLVAGTSYYVRVGYGADRASCYANFCAPIEVVTAPVDATNIKFTNADEKSFTLTWDAAPGANAYYIEYNDQVFASPTNSVQIPYTGKSYAYVYSARVNAAGTYAALSGSGYVKDISALSKKIAKDDFGFVKAYTNINVFYVGANYYGHGLDVQFYNLKKNKKAYSGTTTGDYVRIEDKLKYNIMYKYRVRAYINTTDGKKVPGKWSSWNYMINPKKCTYTTSGKSIKLNWSKLTGVSKIKVQVSTKENSGYKTVATLKGNKTSYTIKKFKGKSLKKGKKYYFKVVYYAKNGKKTYASDIITTGSTTIR